MTTIVTNLISFPLTEIFPKNDFDRGNKKLALHFYIAHNNRKATKIWFEKMVKECPQHLESRSPVAGLTPLAVSAMAGDLETAQMLVNKGANCKTQDQIGWTPLHYAYARNDERMIALLEQTGRTHHLGLEFIRNREYLSPSEIPQRINIPLPQESTLVFHYMNKEGRIKTGTAKKFRELTGAQFSQRIMVTREGMIRGWWDSIEMFKDPKKIYTNQHLLDLLPIDFYKDKPPLFIVKDPQYEETAGYDVFSGSNIEPGQLVTYYSGVQVGSDRLSPNGDINPYQCGQISALEYRNMGGMINDSFPNCALVTFPKLDGVSKTPLIISIEEIPRGEKLFISYGEGHPVTLNYREMNLTAAETFFKGRSISSCPDFPTSIEQLGVLHKFRHLTVRPNLLIHLLLKGILKIEDVREADCSLMALLVTRSGKQLLSDTIETMEEFFNKFKNFQEKHPKLAAQILTKLIDVNLNSPLMSFKYVFSYTIALMNDLIEPNHIDIPIEKHFVCVDNIVKSTSLAYKLRCSEMPNESLLKEFYLSLDDVPKEFAQELGLYVHRFHLRHFIDTHPSSYNKGILENLGLSLNLTEIPDII